jgi:hypothetical protein
MIGNRRFREAQYEARRQQDYEEALRREFLNSEQMRVDYLFQTDIKLRQHYEILEKKAAEKRQRNYAFCQDICWNMVEFAFKVRLTLVINLL